MLYREKRRMQTLWWERTPSGCNCFKLEGVSSLSTWGGGASQSIFFFFFFVIWTATLTLLLNACASLKACWEENPRNFWILKYLQSSFIHVKLGLNANLEQKTQPFFTQSQGEGPPTLSGLSTVICKVIRHLIRTFKSVKSQMLKKKNPTTNTSRFSGLNQNRVEPTLAEPLSLGNS